MTKAEQKRLVRTFTKNVLASVLERADRWPEEWDGFELRALLAVAFACEVQSVAARDPRSYPPKIDRKRTNAFEKVCNVESLP